MNHVALASEACQLLRTATALRRAGRMAEASDALVRATGLISRATNAMDRLREQIVAGVEAIGKRHHDRPTILVVDDEAAVLKLLALALDSAGYEVLTARSTTAAVAALQSRPCVDFVLIDVQMPAPWDGPRTLRELRRFDPGLRFAFMSGSTGDYSAEDLLALGALRVFPKPFTSLAALADELRELVPS